MAKKRRYRGSSTSPIAELIVLLGLIVAGVLTQLNISVELLVVLMIMGVLLFGGLALAVAFLIRSRQLKKIRALRMVDIDVMTGRQFEEYLAALLKHRGYTNIQLTQLSGDFGADLIATKDGTKYAIQAKRYVGMVGVAALYQCFGGQKYYNCDESMVITNATFTEAAQELAEKSGAVLVDGPLLAEWIVEFQQQL